ncbi:cytosolic arginine sensor for mTORC1 subunit 2 [Lingula anatina]|uniref:Cytosolic arginine sensor for mTORC1 subunit 2 n=1 Tax=Lingula anatina TaxID=7574 RepID=A0A1S3HJS9_LINAN|nr:cytosolic arginine sensor for mTORC1 subunit 2 [Lingula anatina]|eukprot:XP_013386380.1 cytosolic arginine sensor for mTORC1 subunit 2 [Lingula anatina]
MMSSRGSGGSLSFPQPDFETCFIRPHCALSFSSRFGNDHIMELTVLDHKLHICSIAKRSIPAFTHSLIKLSLLNFTGCQFFSFTETCDDFTLVVDDAGYQSLSSSREHIETDGNVWLALTVSFGPGTSMVTMGITNIAKSLIVPLADGSVPIYCLSTYQSDFILVKEKDIDRVIEIMSSKVQIFKQVDGEHVLVEKPEQVSNHEHVAKDRLILHKFKTPKNRFLLTSINPDSLHTVGVALIQNMFYSESCNDLIEDQEKFFSFSLVEKDVSIVLDEQTLQRFPPNTLFINNEFWRMVKIGDIPEGLGFDECGIAAQMSEPIADANISEYYISTYYSDQMLVPENRLEEVLELLHSRQVRVGADLVKEKDIDRVIEIMSSKVQIFKQVDGEHVLVEKPEQVSNHEHVAKGSLYLFPTDRLIIHKFKTPKNRFLLTSINPDSLHTVGVALIQNMFYSESCNDLIEDQEKFFSFSLVEKDVSIVLDEQTLQRFPPNTLFINNEFWRMVKIGDIPEGLGFDECGIAAQMSEPIADANISEYYISTYYSDQMLVPENRLEEVLELLHSRQVRVGADLPSD